MLIFVRKYWNYILRDIVVTNNIIMSGMLIVKYLTRDIFIFFDDNFFHYNSQNVDILDQNTCK